MLSRPSEPTAAGFVPLLPTYFPPSYSGYSKMQNVDTYAVSTAWQIFQKEEQRSDSFGPTESPVYPQLRLIHCIILIQHMPLYSKGHMVSIRLFFPIDSSFLDDIIPKRRGRSILLARVLACIRVGWEICG